MLSKDQILGARSKLKTETINIPEWGGDIAIREMSGSQRDYLDNLIASRMVDGKLKSTKDLRAAYVILSVVDSEGRPMFTDNDKEAIGELSGNVLDKIVGAVTSLNKIEEQSLEDLEKN